MSKTVTSETIAAQLTDLILSGELEPGSIVSEVGLADRFHVSRTPVREAIRQLSQSGLITLRPRQRPIVAKLSVADALDRFEALAMLEADCCELAAARRTARQMDRIRTLHEDARASFAADDIATYFEINEDFHREISRASANAYISERAIEMRTRLRSLRAPRDNAPERMAASFAEHEAIVAAIEAGDPQTARRQMLIHVNMLGERATEFVRAYARQTAEDNSL